MKYLLLNYRSAYILLSFLFVFGLSSCGDDGTSAINIFSTSDDVALGKQLDSQIRATPAEYPIYNDVTANQYVQNIANEIIKSSLIKYKGTFVYKTQIIKVDTIVNAFATPGGYVYVYTGLLKFIDNEATLASILAHEIAHAERRHSTARMTKQYGVDFLLSLVLGNNPSQYATIAANLFTGLGFLKNSRDDEYEADEYAFKYLQTSIWYPGAMTYFFDKVKSGNASFLEVLLSTHPMPEDRIQKVKDLINAAGLATPTEANLFADRYANFKKSL